MLRIRVARRRATTRSALTLVLALAALGPAFTPASAGVVAFQSNRCNDAADAQARREVVLLPGPVPTCRSAIWTVRDDGTQLLRITDGSAPVTSGDFAPAWTPDGARVVFGRALPGPAQGGARIFVTGARGGPVTQLTPTQTPEAQFHSDGGPTVSPDGRTIAFHSDRAFPGRPAGGRFDSDIYLMNLDGSNLRVLVPGPTSDADPAFSPDGRRVLFTRSDTLANPRIFSVDAATGGAPYQHTITGIPASGGAFSPSGAHIALSILGRLFTMSADGRALQVRVAAPSFEPTWVGAGESIIYAGPPTELPTERTVTLFRAPLTGAPTAPGALLAPYAFDAAPAWRPDGALGPLDPIVEAVPPVASLLDGVTSALPEAIEEAPPAASEPAADNLLRSSARTVARTLRPRRARLTVKRMSHLKYVAADVSGLRRVELSLERRLPGGGCRPLASDGRLAARRSCGTPPWLAPRSPSAWKTWMTRLGRGTYLVRVRATDRRGRTTPRPTTVVVRDT